MFFPARNNSLGASLHMHIKLCIASRFSHCFIGNCLTNSMMDTTNHGKGFLFSCPHSWPHLSPLPAPTPKSQPPSTRLHQYSNKTTTVWLAVMSSTRINGVFHGERLLLEAANFPASINYSRLWQPFLKHVRNAMKNSTIRAPQGQHNVAQTIQQNDQ